MKTSKPQLFIYRYLTRDVRSESTITTTKKIINRIPLYIRLLAKYMLARNMFFFSFFLFSVYLFVVFHLLPRWNIHCHSSSTKMNILLNNTNMSVLQKMPIFQGIRYDSGKATLSESLLKLCLRLQLTVVYSERKFALRKNYFVFLFTKKNKTLFSRQPTERVYPSKKDRNKKKKTFSESSRFLFLEKEEKKLLIFLAKVHTETF